MTYSNKVRAEQIKMWIGEMDRYLGKIINEVYDCNKVEQFDFVTQPNVVNDFDRVMERMKKLEKQLYQK
jgi:hypothetical protein